MRQELVDKLQKDFPQIFQDLYGDMRVTCMAWGVATGDGWYELIYKLCDDIMKIGPGPDFKAAQIKEKFGGLRFYTEGHPQDEEKSKAIHKLIGQAENDSYTVCENCGSNEDITVEGAWIQTLCKYCRSHKSEMEEKRNAEYTASHEERMKRRRAKQCNDSKNGPVSPSDVSSEGPSGSLSAAPLDGLLETW
jgi:hypothetical protein